MLLGPRTLARGAVIILLQVHLRLGSRARRRLQPVVHSSLTTSTLDIDDLGGLQILQPLDDLA